MSWVLDKPLAVKNSLTSNCGTGSKRLTVYLA